jgi:hypothetical protein
LVTDVEPFLRELADCIANREPAAVSDRKK